jgi:hypothetical protein
MDEYTKSGTNRIASENEGFSNVLAAANSYVERGWSVTHVKHRDKKPTQKNWQHEPVPPKHLKRVFGTSSGNRSDDALVQLSWSGQWSGHSASESNPTTVPTTANGSAVSTNGSVVRLVSSKTSRGAPSEKNDNCEVEEGEV